MLALILTLLLDEINVGPNILCGYHVLSVRPALISPDKRVFLTLYDVLLIYFYYYFSPTCI